MTLWFLNSKSIGLLPQSQPSQDLKFGPNIAGNAPIEEELWPLDVDLTYESLASLGASHREVKPLLALWWLDENARSLALTYRNEHIIAKIWNPNTITQHDPNSQDPLPINERLYPFSSWRKLIRNTSDCFFLLIHSATASNESTLWIKESHYRSVTTKIIKT